jgi:hypothetical protein
LTAGLLPYKVLGELKGPFFFALECVPTMGRDSDHVGELPSKGHFAYEQVGVEQTGQIQN